MRKVLLITSLLVSALFVSCGSDDDSSSSPSKEVSINGKWQQISSITANGTVKTDACNIKNTLNFKSDGNLDTVNFSDNEDGTIGCNEVALSGAYKFENNKLTFTIPDNDPIVSDVKLSANELVINEEGFITTFKREIN